MAGLSSEVGARIWGIEQRRVRATAPETGYGGVIVPGMTFQQFMDRVDCQVSKTAACAGHAAFSRDVERLKADNQGFDLSAIAANTWLKQICDMEDEALRSYAETYRSGQLDAWALYK